MNHIIAAYLNISYPLHIYRFLTQSNFHSPKLSYSETKSGGQSSSSGSTAVDDGDDMPNRLKTVINHDDSKNLKKNSNL